MSDDLVKPIEQLEIEMWRRHSLEAAAHIRKLEARIEQLEAALRELSTDWPCCEVSKAMREIASAALEGKKSE